MLPTLKRAETSRRKSLKGNTILRVGRTEVSLDYELENNFIIDAPLPYQVAIAPFLSPFLSPYRPYIDHSYHSCHALRLALTFCYLTLPSYLF